MGGYTFGATHIILEGPEGRRLVPAGRPYKRRPGEQIVGHTDDLKEDERKLQKIADGRGIGMGDLVEKLTRYFRIPPCASCQKRKRVLNQLKLNGWKVEWNQLMDNNEGKEGDPYEGENQEGLIHMNKTDENSFEMTEKKE